MAPVFAHEALRLYLLSLLNDGPKHGYELMRALSDRFGGTYTPSAGTIYPRLAKLEEDGLVVTDLDGRCTIYRITDAGLAELAARAGDLAGIKAEISASVRRLADELRKDIRTNMRGLRADLAATAEQARAGACATPAAIIASAASGRRMLMEAEVILAEFRNDIRIELRRASDNSLDGLTLETLRTVLGQARISIESALGHRKP
ncbi:PadR family transcriptional regulator [Paeniglutamicibacter cryotolerans]|uniref:DNA-binding PadR family transcriptional regulator n=1 Tax=Paeniglutamicibacter cryotolerans TaxID=670079 RepID=A0A839QMT3_9MICC|nr:PadR family transcriptional regulator [Paeniglutamicibacter cryotolerans]MBB2994522.1 DNA-binding PadR family transcriptional regulator [Paeniglutamicibacter cryotolerans]